MKVGTEGLGLFETIGRGISSGAITIHELGPALRDQALVKSASKYAKEVQRVRAGLVEWLDNCAGIDGVKEITADDVFVVAETLGLTQGDTRWLGCVAKGWGRMLPTGKYQKSSLKQRHARPVPVWRWV